MSARIKIKSGLLEICCEPLFWFLLLSPNMFLDMSYLYLWLKTKLSSILTYISMTLLHSKLQNLQEQAVLVLKIMFKILIMLKTNLAHCEIKKNISHCFLYKFSRKWKITTGKTFHVAENQFQYLERFLRYFQVHCSKIDKHPLGTHLIFSVFRVGKMNHVLQFWSSLREGNWKLLSLSLQKSDEDLSISYFTILWKNKMDK